MIDERTLDALRELDAQDVADWLGVPKAPGARRKRACVHPDCLSSDAMHVYPGAGRGAHCFSCDTAFDTIAMTRHALGIDFKQAVAELGARFEVGVELTDSVGHTVRAVSGRRRLRRVRPTRQTQPPLRLRDGDPLALIEFAGRLLDDPEAQADEHATLLDGYRRDARREVYQHVLDALELDERAAAYVHEERGVTLDTQALERLGMRGATARQWNALADTIDHDLLELAGLPVHDTGEVWPTRRPGYSEHFIVMAYADEERRVDALRIRATGPSASPKTLSLCGQNNPTLPFLEPWCSAWAKHHGGALVVCEGEMDALAINSAFEECDDPRAFAIALPGASSWRRAWCAGWSALSRVIILADADDAGEQLLDAIGQDVMHTHGDTWIARHMNWSRGVAGHKDANDALISEGHRALRDAVLELIREERPS